MPPKKITGLVWNNEDQTKMLECLIFPFFPPKIILNKRYFELFLEIRKNEKGKPYQNKGENAYAKNRGPDCRGQRENFASRC